MFNLRAVIFLAAVLTSQSIVSRAQADDFSARFSYKDMRDRTTTDSRQSTVGLATAPFIRSSLPTTLFTKEFDDRTFIAVATSFEGARFGHLSCSYICGDTQAHRLRALVGYGDASSFLYVSAGLGLKRAEDYPFAAIGAGLLPERLTASLGVTFELTPSVKIWSELDRATYSYNGPIPGLLNSSISSFSIAGGIKVPFNASTSDTFSTMIAAADPAHVPWWRKVLYWMAPPGTTPR